MNAIYEASALLLENCGQGGFALNVASPTGELFHLEMGEEGHGKPWTPETLVPVWSTTKGISAGALLALLEQHGVPLETPVQAVWSDFPAGATLAQLLSHQAGVAALETPLSVFDRAAITAHLTQQPPQWPLGTGHGYHPRTIGYLWDAVAEKIAGMRLGAWFAKNIAEPLDIDFYIGLPPEHHSRVAKVFPGKPEKRPEEQAFILAYGQRSSLTRRAFESLQGLRGVAEFNAPQAWELGSPAFGGVGSARGIARFYGALAAAEAPFSASIRSQAETTLSDGLDHVLLVQTCFTAGFQKNPKHGPERFPGSARCFGHPGAGGSIGYADPANGWGVGFVLNVLDPGVFPNKRILGLLRAVMAYLAN